MMVLIKSYALPDSGQVQLTIDETFEINITAEDACQKVDRWLSDQVSYMMGAESPLLVIGERPVWRLSVFLTASHLGKVGQVGTVDVDVETGYINNSSNQIDILQQAGLRLGQQIAEYQPGRSLPDKYWANEVEPTSSRTEQQQTSVVNLLPTP